MKNPFKVIFRTPIPPEDIKKATTGEWHPVYVAYRFRAEGVKIALQMLLGFAIAVILIAKLFCRTFLPFSLINSFWAFKPSTLDLVGHALAYSAGIELAYTLFTPGPDEALDPVMMGLAAAMLLGISQVAMLTVSEAGAAVLYCLALGGLFAIRKWLQK